MAVAVAALSRAGIILKGDLIFTGVIDEEDGSAGSIDLVKKGLQADGAIVGEPTGFDLCLGQRGLEWLEFRFQGATVHGGNRAGAPNAIQWRGSLLRNANGNWPQAQREVASLLGSHP